MILTKMCRKIGCGNVLLGIIYQSSTHAWCFKSNHFPRCFRLHQDCVYSENTCRSFAPLQYDMISAQRVSLSLSLSFSLSFSFSLSLSLSLSETLSLSLSLSSFSILPSFSLLHMHLHTYTNTVSTLHARACTHHYVFMYTYHTPLK